MILPCSLLLLTLRVAAIPSAATICSTACASPASLRHAGVPEALIAAGEPRHAEAGARHSWPHRSLRGLDGSASLAVPVRRAGHLQGGAVGPEGCVRERQPACVGRQPWPLPSPPCARVLVSLLLCTRARHALPVCAAWSAPPPPPSRAGLENFTRSGGSLLLEQGRLGLSQEFVKAMADVDASANVFGVLLSGPKGGGELAVRSSCASHARSRRALLPYSQPNTRSSSRMLSPCCLSCCRQEFCRPAQLPGVRRPAPACRVLPTCRGLGHGCQGGQGRRLLPTHAAEAERW